MRLSVSIIFVLFIVCSVNAQVLPFPENNDYGIVFGERVEKIEEAKYYLVKFNKRNIDNYIILDSITNCIQPRLCDTNAVTYVLYSGDSCYLMVEYLSPAVTVDTIYKFENFLLTRNRPLVFPNNEIISLRYYCFLLRDSILVREPLSYRVSEIQVSRIKPDNQNEILMNMWGTLRPKFANDFSQVLFTSERDDYDDTISIFAYDFELDSIMELYSFSDQWCISPGRINRFSPVYCLSENRNLSKIVEGEIIQLTNYEWPVQISEYYLYKESIIYFTTNCCDPDYGRRLFVYKE